MKKIGVMILLMLAIELKEKEAYSFFYGLSKDEKAQVEVSQEDIELVKSVCAKLNNVFAKHITFNCTVTQEDTPTPRTDRAGNIYIPSGFLKAIKYKLSIQNSFWQCLNRLCKIPEDYKKTAQYEQVCGFYKLEDILVFTIGHEIAHTNKFLTALAQNRLNGLRVEIMNFQELIMWVWNTFVQATVDEIFDLIKRWEWGREMLRSLFGNEDIEYTEPSYIKRFREKELDCDIASIIIAKRAGYDPTSVVMAAIFLFEGGSSSIIKEDRLHPPNSERIDKLMTTLCTILTKEKK